MRSISQRKLTKKLQNVFWIYLTNNFVVTKTDDFRFTEPNISCDLVPLTLENYFCVRDFREEDRVSEYREKLGRREMGFFAQCDGKMVGSIWATVNDSMEPTVVRSYIKLMPGEALIHDIVTGDRSRGLGVGSFMVVKFAPILLNEFGSKKIIIDVNSRNVPSLRMLNKTGLRARETAIYVSAFKRLIFHKVLKSYA